MRLIGDGLCIYCKKQTGNHVNGKCFDVCDICYLKNQAQIVKDNGDSTTESVMMKVMTMGFFEDLKFYIKLPFLYIASIFYNVRNKYHNR